MKTALNVIVTSLLCLSSLRADPSGEVRIPLATYQDLVDKARANGVVQDEDEGVLGEPRFLEAKLIGMLSKRSLSVEVRLVVEGSAPRWHIVPVVPLDVALLDATINGGGTIISHEGMRALAFFGTGRRSLVAHFLTSGGESGSARQAELNVLPAVSREVFIELPGKLEAEVTPSQLVSVERVGGTRFLRGYAPASEGAISVRWSTDGAMQDDLPEVPEAPKAPTSKEPPRINVQTSMLASIGERLLTVYTTFRYAIFHAPVSRFEWTVPAGVEVIGVQGRGVTDWTCAEGPGDRVCFVELPFPVQRTYELSVQIEQPLPKDATRVLVPAPTAKGVQRQSGHLAVEVMGNAEVKPAEGGGAVREDVRELPPDLFAGQSTPILLAFKFLEAPVKVNLDVKRRESVEMSPISVDDASFTTVWTTEGRTITEGNMMVRNRQRQFLAIRLPEGAVIQSAFVGDAPVKPSTGEDGRLRIPLRNNGRGSETQSFAVQIVYILDNQPLPGLGNLNAQLPSLDAEVGALHHTLILPDHQKLWAFGGDLNIETPRVVHDPGTSSSRRGSMLMALDKAAPAEFAEMAPPQAQVQQQMNAPLRRQKKAANAKFGARSAGGAGAMATDEIVIEGEEDNFDTAPMPVGNTGVLPVRIQIPQSGDRYTAHAFYVPPNGTRLWHARVASSSTQNTLLGAMALLGIALGAFMLRAGSRLVKRPLFAEKSQLAVLVCLLVSIAMTVYFRRMMMPLPGFVVVGMIGAWTLRKVREQEEQPQKPA